MVKLTTDIIERKYSQILTSKSLSKTIKKEELQKLTHLHMNDMFISSIVSYIERERYIYIYNIFSEQCNSFLIKFHVYIGRPRYS